MKLQGGASCLFPIAFFLSTLILATPSPGHARLGETYEQCVLRYGKPPAFTGGTEEYGAIQFLIFSKPPFEQIRIAFREDRAAYIEYQQFGGMPFETIQTILDAQFDTIGEMEFTEKDLAENAGRAMGVCSWKSNKGYLGSYRCLGGESYLILKEGDFDRYAQGLAEEEQKSQEKQLRNSEKSKLKGL